MTHNFCILWTILVLFIKDIQSNVLHFTKDGQLPPVIIVPGDGGCMIEAKINKTSSSNSSCPTQRDWFREWLNVEELLPENFHCQIEVLKFLFDEKTNTSYSPPGIETRIPGFGQTHTVEYIDDSWAAYLLDDVGAYAHALVKELVAYGLVRDVSVRGAPYDFRLSMASQKTYFERLKLLVEDTYRKNGNSKVALLTHSMGGFYTTWFLNLQLQSWKDQYVDCVITLSTPWGGSTESIQAIVSGFTFHHSFILNPLIARQEQRTWESDYLLLPNAKLWPEGQPFVITDQRNYTATSEDMTALFERIGAPTKLYQYVRDANFLDASASFRPSHPGVKSFCVFGTQVPTNHILDYRGKKFPDEAPEMITISGDGTVSHASLSACQVWSNDDEVIQVPSATHTGLLQDKPGIDVVLNILQSRAKYRK